MRLENRNCFFHAVKCVVINTNLLSRLISLSQPIPLCLWSGSPVVWLSGASSCQVLNAGQGLMEQEWALCG